MNPESLDFAVMTLGRVKTSGAGVGTVYGAFRLQSYQSYTETASLLRCFAGTSMIAESVSNERFYTGAQIRHSSQRPCWVLVYLRSFTSPLL